MSRIVIILVLVCFGCYTGKIPCPKFKAKKTVHHKKFRSFSASSSTEITEKDFQANTTKPGSDRYVRNISIEEWDCPEPGNKKYLPRHIKQNIRRNTRIVSEDTQKLTADSTAIQ